MVRAAITEKQQPTMTAHPDSRGRMDSVSETIAQIVSLPVAQSVAQWQNASDSTLLPMINLMLADSTKKIHHNHKLASEDHPVGNIAFQMTTWMLNVTPPILKKIMKTRSAVICPAINLIGTWPEPIAPTSPRWRLISATRN